MFIIFLSFFFFSSATCAHHRSYHFVWPSSFALTLAGKSDVDEGVLSFYHGLNTADTIVEVIGANGSCIHWLSHLSNFTSDHFDASRKTIVFANGWVSDARTKDLLYAIAKCCSDYNLIVVDFATSITHLFRTSTHDMELASYALFKVIDTLLLQHCHYKDIIVAGFGVGAQIAAATCHIVARERLHSKRKLSLLVAIDPSTVCGAGCGYSNYIGPEAADKVLVIHGNNGIYGMPEALGTVDYYPNGECALQPGCRTEVCSRVRALAIFAESICHPKGFKAIQCDSWTKWRRGQCNDNEMITINLKLPKGVRGQFYGTTRARSPYGRGTKAVRPAAALIKQRNCS